jgi:acetylglutamate kinase
MFEHGLVPVIAPLARGADDGQVYNLNADTAAGVLAGALGAEKLVYLTDVEGLFRNPDDDESLIQKMNLSEGRHLLAGGSISGGMLPKLESCIAAMEAGVRRTHILDGRVQHALLLEIFTPEGIGTMIRHDEDD